MPADPTVPTSPAVPAPADPWAAGQVLPTPAVGEEPTVPVHPAPVPIPVNPIPVQPVAIQPAPPAPEKWAGRVAVPGASGPGQKKPAAPTAPTQLMARQAAPGRARDVPVARGSDRRRRGSGARRFLGALLALLLLVAVPVVSAYVAYKLASGESPFEWPPTVDYSNVF